MSQPEIKGEGPELDNTPVPDPDKAEGHIVARHTEITTSTWHGPLPPPDDLKKYEEVLPNAAHRIIALAEQQGEHRRSLEQKTAHWDHQRTLCGMATSTFIMTGLITAAIIALTQGFQTAAISLGGLGGAAFLAPLTQWFWRSRKGNGQ